MMTNGKPITVKARIADLNVLMHCKTVFMLKRLEKYAFDFAGTPEVVIDVSEAQIADYCDRYKLMGRENAEYMLSGAAFYNALYREYNGLMLHASGIAMDGKGYLFSANSGVGKSTHTSLWKAYFGERVRYINDDKPALRLMQDGWVAYGTPWSGKTALHENISVPVQALAFIVRSTENSITRLQTPDIISNLMEQTIRPKTAKSADCFFPLLEKLIADVPVYALCCDISQQAVEVAYETMKQ